MSSEAVASIDREIGVNIAVSSPAVEPSSSESEFSSVGAPRCCIETCRAQDGSPDPVDVDGKAPAERGGVADWPVAAVDPCGCDALGWSSVGGRKLGIAMSVLSVRASLLFDGLAPRVRPKCAD